MAADDNRSVVADSWSIKSAYGSTLDEEQRYADTAEVNCPSSPSFCPSPSPSPSRSSPHGTRRTVGHKAAGGVWGDAIFTLGQHHRAVVAIGLHEGFSSSLFSTAAIFAFVVMYDAFGVRLHAGRQGEHHTLQSWRVSASRCFIRPGEREVSVPFLRCIQLVGIMGTNGCCTK